VGIYYLAQMNIGRLRAPVDSPEVAEFVALLDPINALADTAPGFVWRLQTEDGNATAVRILDDDTLIVNMSVWESLDALAAFVYESHHRDVMRRRREWFNRMAESYLVLWWVEAGHIPAVAEAEERLLHLRRHGPTARAFTFKALYPAPDGTGAPGRGDNDPWACPTR
jgi:heme-degrading monooxygenase HmoA